MEVMEFPGCTVSYRSQMVTTREAGEVKANASLTELTSGTPIDPGSPRSGVVEALQHRSSRIYSVAAGTDIALDIAVAIVVVLAVVITTTTIIITG